MTLYTKPITKSIDELHTPSHYTSNLCLIFKQRQEQKHNYILNTQSTVPVKALELAFAMF